MPAAITTSPTSAVASPSACICAESSGVESRWSGTILSAVIATKCSVAMATTNNPVPAAMRQRPSLRHCSAASAAPEKTVAHSTEATT